MVPRSRRDLNRSWVFRLRGWNVLLRRRRKFGEITSAEPGSDRRGRLVLAALLIVMGGMLGMAATGGSAEATAWSAARDLAAGEQVTGADFIEVPVDVPNPGQLVGTTAAPTGTLLAPLRSGDVLVTDAIGSEPGQDLAEVTLGLDAATMPLTLSVGDKVDIWARRDSAAPQQLLTGVTVVALAWGETTYQGTPAVSVAVPVAFTRDALVAASADQVFVVRSDV